MAASEKSFSNKDRREIAAVNPADNMRFDYPQWTNAQLSASNATAPAPATPPVPERTDVASNYAVLLTSGPEDGGKRATLALSAACTAQAMDLNTIMFLVGDGVHWGYDGHADDVHVQGFSPLHELMEAFLEMGGQMLMCSACDAVCSAPSDPEGRRLARRTGVHPQGLAAVLSHTLLGGSVTF